MLIGFHNGRCNTCEQRIVPNDMLEHADENDYTEAEIDIIDNIYKTQPAFIHTIESLRGLWNKLTKKHNSLVKTTHRSVKKFREDLANVIGFLKDKSKEKVKEILTSDEYIQYKKDSLSYAIKLKRFLNNWGVNPYNLGSYLRRRRQHSIFLYSGHNTIRRFKSRLLRKFRFRI